MKWLPVGMTPFELAGAMGAHGLLVRCIEHATDADGRIAARAFPKHGTTGGDIDEWVRGGLQHTDGGVCSIQSDVLPPPNVRASKGAGRRGGTGRLGSRDW